MPNRSTKIQIRRATAADVWFIAHISAQTFYETYAQHNKSENIEKYLSASFSFSKIQQELADDGNVFLLAIVEKNVVGYAKLSPNPSPEALKEHHAMEIHRIYVRRDFISQKIGAALMQRCLDEAIKRNFNTVWLTVGEQNTRAIRFYEKFAFEHMGRHILLIGDEPQKFVLMFKTLETTVSTTPSNQP